MILKRIAGIAAVSILLIVVAANGAGVLNTPTSGYLLCINSKTKVVTHPGTLNCPKGTKGLIVGAKGLDGSAGVPGLVGAAGINGRDGKDGKTLWNGVKDPENSWGDPGDIFINSQTNTLFGPKKLDGTWPAGVSMIGPKGDQGPMGLPGVNGSNGSNGVTGPQGLIGLTGATGLTGVAEPLASGSNCIGAKCSFKVGDVGPAGGTIFYVDYFNQYPGFNYLEVAPSSCGGRVTWASQSTSVIPSTSWSLRAVGTGADLTAKIKTSLPNDTRLNNAAWFATSCTASLSSGSADWFLGSVGEMKMLNDNLQGLAGLFAYWYWTSSEGSSTNAWFVKLADDSISNDVKTNLYNVIPIRSF